MAISNSPTVQELKELAENYPHLEVTRLDSLMVGNCERGNDDFIEEYFEGQSGGIASLLYKRSFAHRRG